MEKERRNKVSNEGGEDGRKERRKPGNSMRKVCLFIILSTSPLRSDWFKEQFKNGYLDHQRLELYKLLGDLTSSENQALAGAVFGCGKG